jgi:guanylate kinase
MSNTPPHRLIVIAGPSCVGKTPLVKALAKFYPELYKSLHKLVIYTSREKRKGEYEGVDYYYRSREEIEKMGANDNYQLIRARGHMQAVDLQHLQQLLLKGDVLYEGNTFTGNVLIKESKHCLNVFVSPLSKSDIQNLKTANPAVNLESISFELMKRKLVRRAQNFGQKLTKSVMNNIKIRASETYSELKQAWQFSYVLPNHDGEDSDNWHLADIPLGDAFKALHALALLIEGKINPTIEQWHEDLLS